MKFAHISDIHLGFQRDEALQKLECDIFEKTLDQCISNKVDFVVIPGDIFHVNIPDMRVQKYAFGKFKQVHEAGIPIYVIHGNHDYSPSNNSIIDLLAKTEYITIIPQPIKTKDDNLSIKFISDAKTGVKLTGLPGLTSGKDITLYEKLDKSMLESEDGFKIFLFHSNIINSKKNSEIGMSYTMLPKGFNYYAGGHLHEFSNKKYNEYSHIVYSGSPFAGYSTDIEKNAGGTKRGYVLVEFSNKVDDIKFIEIADTQYEIIDIDADNKTTYIINNLLNKKINKTNVVNKIIIIKIHGKIKRGKVGDINTSPITKQLINQGAITVLVNKTIESEEYSMSHVLGNNRSEIECNVFKKNLKSNKFKQNELKNSKGAKLAEHLFNKVSAPQLENENKDQYLDRIKKDVLGILGIDLDDT